MQVRMFQKKKNRIWGRLWISVLMLTAVAVCAGGCGKKSEDDLTVYSVEKEQTEKTEVPENQKEDTQQSPAEHSVNETVVVYVCGAVYTPGVYELPFGARIHEAIAMAGGVREDAAEESINQAQQLEDGTRIYIPTVEEMAQKPSGSGELWQENPQTDSSSSGKININTATVEELTTLSGIGESRAQSIIRYRETNGAFQSIEELMNVEGIKDGIFEKIKDEIEV